MNFNGVELSLRVALISSLSATCFGFPDSNFSVFGISLILLLSFKSVSMGNSQINRLDAPFIAASSTSYLVGTEHFTAKETLQKIAKTKKDGLKSINL